MTARELVDHILWFVWMGMAVAVGLGWMPDARVVACCAFLALAATCRLDARGSR